MDNIFQEKYYECKPIEGFFPELVEFTALKYYTINMVNEGEVSRINSIIKGLSDRYVMEDCKLRNNQYIFKICAKDNEMECPYCGNKSSSVHSEYLREIQDLPIQNQKVILLVNTRKFFCKNNNCSHKTFSEKHPFVRDKGKKTLRLENFILTQSLDVSSVNSSKMLLQEGISVSKSSICEMVKKNSKS